MAKLVRAKWLLIPVLLIVIVAGYAGDQYLSHWETTDDAQVDGHIHPGRFQGPLGARDEPTPGAVYCLHTRKVEAHSADAHGSNPGNLGVQRPQ